MENLDDGATENDEKLWPRFTVDVDRARTRARTVERPVPEPATPSEVEQLSARVEELTQTLAGVQMDLARQPTQAQSTADQNSMATDLGWLNVRILALEASRNDSRAESAALTKYIELCFEVIRSQDERLSEQHRIVEEEVGRLLGRSSRHEQDILDLRSSHNVSAERMEFATAEFLELANAASMLSAHAIDSAEITAEETELLTLRIVEVDMDFRAAAERLAEELRAVELLAQEAAAQLEVELRDADEEIRVMAEKAADRADFSIDSVSGLQADLEDEAAKIREKLNEVASREKGEVESTQQIDAIAASIRKEVAREIQNLKRKLDAGDESPREQKKRFRYYLPEEKSQATEPKALEAATAQDTTQE